MATRLLVDAAHPEETRVVVVSGTRLDEFDFESAAKKQLKGNIYLAKVTRVEPSLQAAFVEYGGNRHGFLAFGDIHPDYYQIPVADRQKLQAERAAEEAAQGRAEEAAAESQIRNEPVDIDAAPEPPQRPDSPDSPDGDGDAPGQPETVGGDDLEDLRPRREVRRYKIQEVIKRRQVLLVQVVKEERGTKGAALTTYLSLAGRYCVLMPNTARGGGVSRKIANANDRSRLRDIIGGLEVPPGMGLIVRTAGQQRTKADIRRDYDYLLRVWNSVRELTLQSVAPTMVYEEANLIKRAIRDLYSNEIDEVLVEGDDGYKAAKGIMKMLMPSHAKRVQKYEDRIPLFHRYQVEQQLDLMHSPTVQLRSGGYIVLNSTEALVAIDVNSGRSTRERNIEATALKTNLEAAEEVARQLRLRDLAGLVVIDFIDMDVSRNNRAVVRKLKDSLKGDRARIQLGRISAFGLLELSRQRMRPSLLETSSNPCPTCGGTGLVRSTESAALHVMRVIEDEGIRGPAHLAVGVPPAVALYLLNQKRASLGELETRFRIRISILPDPDLIPPAHTLERTALEEAAPVAAGGRSAEHHAAPDLEPADDATVVEPDDEIDAEETAPEPVAATADDGEARAPKRRRRGKRGGRRRRRKEEGELDAAATGTAAEIGEPGPSESRVAAAASDGASDVAFDVASDGASEAAPEAPPAETGEGGEEAPKPRRRRSRSRAKPAAAEAEAAAAEPVAATKANGGAAPDSDEAAAKKPRRRRARKRKPTDAESVAAEPAESEAAVSASSVTEAPAPEAPPPMPADAEKPARRGWWNFGR